MESSVPRWYFVVLPDRDEATALAERLPTRETRTVPHASGRPWLVVALPDEQIVTAEAGDDRAAVLGHSSATAAGLREAAGRAGGVEAFDELSHTLAGGFHLAASVGGRLRVQGSASGVQRVFHAVIDGVAVASDRADVLAELGAFPYEETALAIRLLPTLPHPLGEQPLWQGVEPLPPESYLRIEADGRRTAVRRWWRRPEPHLSRARGAELLRTALADAVAVRTRQGGVVHCDLSGGLDSTPVTWFAAQGPAEIVATTAYSGDPGGREDLDWARRALAAMPAVRHRTQSLDEPPAFYEGMPELANRLDEPTHTYLVAPRINANIQAALRHSARMYLNGLGGDHLQSGLPNWEHTLLRRRPLLAWHRARTHPMLSRTSPAATVRGLLDRRGYGEWLRTAAAPAHRDRPGGVTGFGWDLPLTWPLWMTPDAVRAVRRRIDALAAGTEPLGPDRAGHAELALVRDGARVVRGTGQLGADAELPFQAPLLDDRVLEAYLAVRREERVTPLEFKPLMKEAMRGLLPEEHLARTTKTGGDPQAVRGFAAHHTEIFDLCTASPLAELGIVDDDALRRHNRPQPGRMPDGAFRPTVNCAVFLRAQARGRLVAPARAAAARSDA
ncbi:asparagine synthase-related protein [Streptomyces sp. NPDC002701]|uniref:asparagine synthase-related protein n=1 Tax=Streptomyces sp. NPDC002701 TaxID=3364661 RepID=UPI003679108F